MDKELLEKLIKSLRNGLPAVESKNSGGYQAKNDSTNALGKYQFVPSHHWNDIKKFAKSRHNETLSDYQDFLDKPYLQEDFFEHHVEKNILPRAKKLHKKHGDYRIDEIGALIHFQGGNGATKMLASGKHVTPGKAGTNVSTKKYLEVYNKGLSDNKVEGISNLDVYDQKDKDAIWKQYNDEKDAIQYDDKLSPEVQRLKMDELNKKHYEQGNFDIINEKIDEVNNRLEEGFNQDVSGLKDLMGLADDMDVAYDDDGKGGQKIRYSSKTAFLPSTGDKYNELAEKYPDIVKKDKNGLYFVEEDKLFKEIGTKYSKFTGQDLELIKEDGTRGKDLKIDVSKVKTGLGRFFNMFGENNPDSGEISFAQDFTSQLDNVKYNKDTVGMSNLIKNPAWGTKPSTASAEASTNVPKGPTNTNPYKWSKKDMQQASARAQAQGFEESPDRDRANAEINEATIGASDDFYSLTGEEPKGGVYDTKQFKDNFPYADAFAGLTAGVIGLQAAKKKLPLRDEQVSEAFRGYTAELQKLSQIGLRPEEEAYAKRMLAESYQSGMANIVRASGGNRNVVLGNLGRLDAQKNRSLLELSVADANAKNEALHKYGEAVKYINEFDARRDIANHGIRYEEALRDKQAGAQLAQQGFSKMMNEIQYYKENKPGSANHAYKSYMYRKMFDVDPTLKDDGTGETPYTVSWKEKQDNKRMEAYLGSKRDAEMWSQLSPEQKLTVGKFNKQTGYDTQMSRSFLTHVHETGQTGELNFSNTKKSVETGDFSNMFATMNEDKSASVPNVEKSTVSNFEPNVINSMSTFLGVSNEQNEPVVEEQPVTAKAVYQDDKFAMDQMEQEQSATGEFNLFRNL